MTAPLWILAICALIWTGRMVLAGLLIWLAEYYCYMPTPKWLKWFGKLVTGRF